MCQVQGPPKEWLRGSINVYWEQKILPIFGGGVGNFRLHFLRHFFFNFENLSAHNVANILNFPKHPQILHFGWVWRKLWPFFHKIPFFLRHSVCVYRYTKIITLFARRTGQAYRSVSWEHPLHSHSSVLNNLKWSLHGFRLCQKYGNENWKRESERSAKGWELHNYD